MSTTVSALELSPLERATDRLERAASSAHACFDDLALPDWESFHRSRSRSLDRSAHSESAGALVSLPTRRGDRR
jgi:hypothetical protein